MKTPTSFFYKLITPFLILGVVLGSFGTINLQPLHAQEVSECDDGADNDADGLTDYPEDTDCWDYYGLEATPQPPVTPPTSGGRTNTLGPTTYTYRVPGVYSLTIPSGVFKVTARAWGAGGGGGSGMKARNHHVSGFGGGGGGYAVGEVAVTPGDVVNVVVGAGGYQGEGGGNSEANIDKVAIAGAGGGGGGLSVGGPGYKESSGFLTALAVVAAVVLTVASAGGFAGFAGAFSNVVGVTTGIQTAGAAVLVGEVVVYPAFIVTTTTISGATIGGISAATVLGSAGAALVAGNVASTVFTNPIAVGLQNRDPRRPGGVDGLDGLGFTGVRGGVGGGKGGMWAQTVPTYDPGDDTGGEEAFIPSFKKILSVITLAKQAIASSIQPVAGTGGDGYAGQSIAGGTGGAYSFVGGNPYASSGGMSGSGDSVGGLRGRYGRDGSGQGNAGDTRAQDGGFPGSGGGGSDTGTGGYGGDGQVVLELSADGVVATVAKPNGPQCRDGIDNDGDNIIDYPLDPGCENANDDDESDMGTENNPPSRPVISCPTDLVAGATGNFTALSRDPDTGDTITYTFDWSGGVPTVLSNIPSGDTVATTKSWSIVGIKTVNVSVHDNNNPPAYGVGSESCMVNVTAAPVDMPEVHLLANPGSVDAGGSTRLTWVALNATSCIASGGWSGAKSIIGSTNTAPLSVPTLFTLTCTGPNGTDSDSIVVGINSVGNGITWNDIDTPITAVAGSLITFTADVTNSGTQTWGTGYRFVVKDSQHEDIQQVGLDAVVTPESSGVPEFSFRVPTTLGNYTFYFQALEPGVEWFGPEILKTITVVAGLPPAGGYPPTARGNAIEYISNPTSVAAGQTFTVQVRNTGTRAWGSDHKLNIKPTTGNSVFQTDLGSTAPNGQKTVTMTAPSTPGNYVLEAEEHNVENFGERRPVTVTVLPPTNGNGITYISNPTSVNTGQSFTVQVRNSGTKVWGDNHRLTLRNQGGASVFFRDIGPADLGEQKSVSMLAPLTAGNYYLQAQEYSVGDFGEMRPITVSTVIVPPGGLNDISYEDIPSSVYTNQQFQISVRNTGQKDWTSNHKLWIYDTPSFGNKIGAFGNLTGVAKTFPHTVYMTAPSTPGSYVIKAVENDFEWFGATRSLLVTTDDGGGGGGGGGATCINRDGPFRAEMFVTEGVRRAHLYWNTHGTYGGIQCKSLGWTSNVYFGYKSAQGESEWNIAPPFPPAWNLYCWAVGSTSENPDATPRAQFTVSSVCPPTSLPNFTVSASSPVPLQTVPTIGGTSRPATISIGPVDGFGSPVTITATPPAAFSAFNTIEYSWNGGAFGSSPVVTVTKTANGYPGTTLAIRVSGGTVVSGNYTMSLSALGGTLPAKPFSYTLQVNKTDIQFKEE